MREPAFAKSPRFQVGNQVIALTPSPQRGKQGVVIEVIEPAGDLVYRYVVRFTDGATETLFGFELRLL
jgi:hypothetical protein